MASLLIHKRRVTCFVHDKQLAEKREYTSPAGEHVTYCFNKHLTIFERAARIGRAVPPPCHFLQLCHDYKTGKNKNIKHERGVEVSLKVLNSWEQLVKQWGNWYCGCWWWLRGTANEALTWRSCGQWEGSRGQWEGSCGQWEEGYMPAPQGLCLSSKESTEGRAGASHGHGHQTADGRPTGHAVSFLTSFFWDISSGNEKWHIQGLLNLL